MTSRDFHIGRKRICRREISLFFLCGFFIIGLLSIHPQNQGASKRIQIMTSVFPLMEFAKAVSGERGEVSLLLPPGAEIHTWQPRPSDIIRLSSARLFVYIGSNLEPWINDILKSVKNPGLKVIEASQGFSLIGDEAHNSHHEQEMKDPHIWLDFGYDQMIVDRIAAVLSVMEPDSAPAFEKNALACKEKLKKLDQKFRDGLKDCLQRTFIIGGHAAFSYLARRYDLHQVSLYGLSPDSAPTAKKLVEAVELAKKQKINVIFFEIQVSSKLAKILADEVGARTLVLNPGANLTREQLKSGVSFFDIMERNLENLKDGLICN